MNGDLSRNACLRDADAPRNRRVATLWLLERAIIPQVDPGVDLGCVATLPPAVLRLVSQPAHLVPELAGGELARAPRPPVVGAVEGLEGYREFVPDLAFLPHKGRHHVDRCPVGGRVGLDLGRRRQEALLSPRQGTAYGPSENALLVLWLLEGKSHVLDMHVAWLRFEVEGERDGPDALPEGVIRPAQVDPVVAVKDQRELGLELEHAAVLETGRDQIAPGQPLEQLRIEAHLVRHLADHHEAGPHEPGELVGDLLGLTLLHEGLVSEHLGVVRPKYLAVGANDGRLPRVLRTVGIEEGLLGGVAGKPVPEHALEVVHHLHVPAHREANGLLPEIAHHIRLVCDRGNARHQVGGIMLEPDPRTQVDGPVGDVQQVPVLVEVARVDLETWERHCLVDDRPDHAVRLEPVRLVSVSLPLVWIWLGAGAVVEHARERMNVRLDEVARSLLPSARVVDVPAGLSLAVPDAGGRELCEVPRQHHIGVAVTGRGDRPERRAVGLNLLDSSAVVEVIIDAGLHAAAPWASGTWTSSGRAPRATSATPSRSTA